MKIAFVLTLGISFIILACNSKQDTLSTARDGKNVFETMCITCHGANGKLMLNGAKDLTKSILTIEERVQIITHGKGGMASYKNLLSAKEIQNVAEYTLNIGN